MAKRGGLRLVEEREAELSALRQTLDASIAEGGCKRPARVLLFKGA